MRLKSSGTISVLGIVGLLSSGCSTFGGERVGDSSGVVRTSLLPSSVPYYLNLCGQDDDDQKYRLFAPSALGRWIDGKSPFSGGTAELKKRQQCVKLRKIDNGNPITVRLHRVGIGGLSTFNTDGKCTKGCKRDVAIVLDFNGSQNLQKPIVAFYQRDVTPDANLQFVNQTIFTQAEWFYRYPPSIRVRLYDVRDDKDRALRANLETVGRGFNVIKTYIAGAAVGGPIVDTALRAAEQLIDGRRNRPILDMSFQLFAQQSDTPVAVVDPATRAEARRKAQENVQTNSADPPRDVVVALQKKLKVPADGVFGPKTQSALSKIKATSTDDGNLNRAARAEAGRLLEEDSAIIEKELVAVANADATFGSPIYASQFIVFNEHADGYKPSQSVHAEACEMTENADPDPRRRIGNELPSFYFVPDGVRYYGARVYRQRSVGDRAMCVLNSPYVIFSITRESSAVSADVAKRISDLQEKFSAESAVTEETVASLSSAFVDAELALAIDRLENTRKVEQLIALVNRIDLQLKNARETHTDDNAHPMPSSTYRNRAFRLIEDYTGCVVAEDVTSQTLALLIGKIRENTDKRRDDGETPPYFVGITCPVDPAKPQGTPDTTEPVAN